MSGVDVLAVMDRAATDELPLMSAVDMKEARAAVAELMAALEGLLPHAEHAESCGDHDSYNNASIRTCGCGLDSAVDLAHAALSRVRGEA